MNFLLTLCVASALAAGPPPVHIKAAEASLRRAKVGRSTRDWISAEKNYLLAIDIEPTFMEAYRGLLELYIAADRPTEAGATLTRILQIEPTSMKDRLLLGNLLLNAGQPMRALAQFGAAMQISNNSDALYGFAQSAEASGMRDRAMEAAVRGVEEFPKEMRFKKIREQLRAAPGRDGR